MINSWEHSNKESDIQVFAPPPPLSTMKCQATLAYPGHSIDQIYLEVI